MLGGTFDPIHDGHLAAGQAAKAALALDRILVVPSHEPPHRPDSPRASGYHRLQMARLGVADIAGWGVSDLELVRGGRVVHLRHAHRAATRLEPASQFFFITGADAFAEVASWRRYPEVLELSHFVVIARTGTSFDAVRSRLPELAPRFVHCDAVRIRGLPAGAIPVDFPGRMRSHPPCPPPRFGGGRPPAQPLDGLVPDAVERYIREHHLYV